MSQFDQFLTTELVRRHELYEGPIADSEVILELNSTKPQLALASKVHQRAAKLAEQLQLNERVADWHSSRHILFGLLIFFALISGVALARGSLAGGEPISIAWMLFTLLGLNLVMLLVWLCFAMFSSNGGGAGGKLLLSLQNYLVWRYLAICGFEPH